MKDKENLYIQQESFFYEIIEKQEEYKNFKNQIERAKEISTDEENYHFLKSFDPNQTWNGDQFNWNRKASNTKTRNHS